MTAAVDLIKTNTLSVWDCATGTSFLVDTGADVCVFPASPNDKRKRTPTENLTAANAFRNQHMGTTCYYFYSRTRKAISSEILLSRRR